MTGKDVLAIPMNPEENDAQASTVKEYLVALVRAVWHDGERFSGKRPFGNSGWQYDLYRPLIKAKTVKGKLDADGYVDSVDDKAADKLILSAINAL